MTTNYVRFELRSDDAVSWNLYNPTLLPGEPGYDTTNNQLRIGTGTTGWVGLRPLAPSVSIPTGTNYGDYLYWNRTGWAVGGEDSTVVLGGNASTTGVRSITIGPNAAGAGSDVAIGMGAQTQYGDVVVGCQAGGTGYDVAIGYQAKGAGNSIAIGQNATANVSGSIVLDTSNGTAGSGAVRAGLFIMPIRDLAGSGGEKFVQMYYNETTGEIVYDSTRPW